MIGPVAIRDAQALLTGALAGLLVQLSKAGPLEFDVVRIPVDEHGSYLPAIDLVMRRSGARLRVTVTANTDAAEGRRTS